MGNLGTRYRLRSDQVDNGCYIRQKPSPRSSQQGTFRKRCSHREARKSRMDSPCIPSHRLRHTDRVHTTRTRMGTWLPEKTICLVDSVYTYRQTEHYLSRCMYQLRNSHRKIRSLVLGDSTSQLCTAYSQWLLHLRCWERSQMEE